MVEFPKNLDCPPYIVDFSKLWLVATRIQNLVVEINVAHSLLQK